MKVDNSISPAAVTHYCYSGWQVLEERDAANSDALLRQFVDGALYIDEHLVMDTDSNSDGDCTDGIGLPGGLVAQWKMNDNAEDTVIADALETNNGAAAVEMWSLY